MDSLKVNRLKLRCEIGFSSHEIGILQEILISYELKVSTKLAGKLDDVTKGVDLKVLTKSIIAHIEKSKFNLIEKVARDVALLCVMQSSAIISVSVTIEKPKAIRFSESSEVVITRSRDDFPSSIAIISIGSNIDPHVNIPKCLEKIQSECGDLHKISSVYKTPFVNDKDDTDKTCDPFLNAACELSTPFDMMMLKRKLLTFEHSLGRVRDPNNKFAPRTIDLDIDYHECADGTKDRDFIADKCLRKFCHVIVPFNDLMPDFHHEELGMTINQLAKKMTKIEKPENYFPQVHMELPKFKRSVNENSCNVFQENETVVGNGYGINGVKVAMVTGGASKIGENISRALHKNGYHVCIHYFTNFEKVDALVNELNKIRQNSAISYSLDFTQACQEAVDGIVSFVIEKWGCLNVIINNASIFKPTDFDNDDVAMSLEKMMHVNVTVPILIIKSASNALSQSSNGSAINICDIHGEKPLLGHVPYCISKSSLIAATRCLARELETRNIRVNGINPGAILWPDGGKCVDSKYKQSIIEKIPLKRLGTVDDIVSAILFLLDNKYVTGQVVNVDGGRSLCQ